MLPLLRFKEQGKGMGSLFLLFRRLVFILKFFNEQTDMFRPGIGKRVSTFKVEIIHKPFFVICMAGKSSPYVIYLKPDLSVQSPYEGDVKGIVE
mgnify:CR=1 FL=1